MVSTYLASWCACFEVFLRKLDQARSDLLFDTIRWRAHLSVSLASSGRAIPSTRREAHYCSIQSIEGMRLDSFHVSLKQDGVDECAQGHLGECPRYRLLLSAGTHPANVRRTLRAHQLDVIDRVHGI